MKFLIRKLALDGTGAHEVAENGIAGTIRIWIADTNKPTDYFILVINDGLPLSVEAGIDSVDYADEFSPKIQAILNNSKLQLNDYGKGRTFHMDIKIPASLAQKYAQRIG